MKKICAVLILLAASVTHAQSKPGRFAGGIQARPQSAWAGATGVGGLYYKTGVGWQARLIDDTEFTLGSVTTVSPLSGTTELSCPTCVVTSGSYSNPSWITALAGSKITGNIGGNAAGFSGSLSGDATGAQGSTTVAKLQGRTVSSSAPSTNDVLTWSGSAWAPAASAGGVTTSSPLSGTTSLSCPTCVVTGGSTFTGANTFSGTQLGTYTLGGTVTVASPILSGTVTGTYTLGGTPTLTAPVLSGTATGTYTLAGTPTITAPSISAPVFSGSATGTYTLAGTPTITAPAISAPVLSGTVTGTYTLGGTPTIAESGVTNLTTDLAAKAPLASPTFTGTVTTPAAITQAANTVETGGSSSTNTIGFKNVQTVADGATTVGFELDNATACATAGCRLLKMKSGSNEMLGVLGLATGFQLVANSSTAGTFTGNLLELRTNDSRWFVGNTAPTGFYLNYNIAGGIEIYANQTNTANITSTAIKPGATGTITMGAASLAWKGVIAGAAAASQPTCDSTTRGDMFPVFAAGGASDTFQICLKAAADTYAWRTVYTAP